MITSHAREKVLKWIEEATSGGASLLTPLVKEGRSLLGPVLLENAPSSASALREEAFAPLAVLQGYDTFEEALSLVNDSHFGLQAGVFSNNLSKALQAFEKNVCCLATADVGNDSAHVFEFRSDSGDSASSRTARRRGDIG